MPLHEWIRTASEELSDHGVFAVRRGLYRREDGLEKTMTTLACPDWANVIALTEKEELVLVRQFRPGPCAPTLETPGGVIDDGEDPLTAGARELLEETGYRSDRISLLGSAHANPALSGNRIHFVLAEAARKVEEPRFDGGEEECEVVLWPFSNVDALLENGLFSHALCWAALAKLQARMKDASSDRR
jgi:ADP-ribose pyrophosphatase